MTPSILGNFDYVAWILIPLMIFSARIVDVSLGTIRLILVSKGQKIIAPLLGFIEVLIWIIIIGQVMDHLDNFLCYIAYAAGFATGNLVGMLIEEKLAMGNVFIRVFSTKSVSKLFNYLNKKGYGVTELSGKGNNGRVNILYLIVERKIIKNTIEIINKFNPTAFYCLEDLRKINERAIMPKTVHHGHRLHSK